MSLTAEPTASTRPLAKIVSLLPDDELQGKTVYLEPDTSSIVRQLFQKAKEDEDAKTTQSTLDDLEPLWPPRLSRLGVAKRRRPEGEGESKANQRQVIRKIEAAKQKVVVKQLALNDYEEFQPLCNPNPEQRDVILLCGPSGAGKTTWTKEWLKSFRASFPEWPIFWFSVIEYDKAIDDSGLNIQRVVINEEMVEKPINVKTELAHSCCVFDDVDSIMDKGLLKEILRVKNAVLETGRHGQTYVLQTSHAMFAGKSRTTIAKSESTAVVLFPHGTHDQIARFLRAELGFDRTQIQRILNTSSRWVELFTTYPRCIMEEKVIRIL